MSLFYIIASIITFGTGFLWATKMTEADIRRENGGKIPGNPKDKNINQQLYELTPEQKTKQIWKSAGLCVIGVLDITACLLFPYLRAMGPVSGETAEMTVQVTDAFAKIFRFLAMGCGGFTILMGTYFMLMCAFPWLNMSGKAASDKMKEEEREQGSKIIVPDSFKKNE